MTDTTIQTATEPAAIAAARRALAAILDADPPASPGGDGETRIYVSEALALLSDVRPPYPPLPPLLQPLPSGAGIAQALTHLDEAIDQATSIADLTRIATVAIILRRATARTS